MEKAKRVTIYDIKYDLQAHSDDHYFDHSTMKFFHQTLKDFSVKRINESVFYISARMKDETGEPVGISARFYSFVTHELSNDMPESQK